MDQDFSGNGQEFVSILGRLSTDFLAKLAKNLSVFLVDSPGFVSKWPRISWHHSWADCPASLVGKAEDFLKLLADDH